ncbi:MAG: PQQ-dependent sugar dehydrogenase [Enterococcus sp.]
MKAKYFLLTVSLLLVGCQRSDPETARSIDSASTSNETRPTESQTRTSEAAVSVSTTPEIVAEELEIPWSIQSFADRFYLSERGGTIVELQGKSLNRQTVVLSAELANEAEAGLLGFVLAPDFATSQRAYAYYTYAESAAVINRVVSLELSGDTWRETDILLDGIVSGAYHHGGRLAIGPDQRLYVTTGDGLYTADAQDRESLRGKILRMNLDGSIPTDNPVADSYVYSFGHRNPQGLTWIDDQLYASEHGDQSNDEVNVIIAGNNYGWPIIQGSQTATAMEAPLVTSGPDTTWAPSGIAAHEGLLYVALLRGEGILVVNPQTQQITIRYQSYGRIRDVMFVEDTIYFVTNNRDGRGSATLKDDYLYRVHP